LSAICPILDKKARKSQKALDIANQWLPNYSNPGVIMANPSDLEAAIETAAENPQSANVDGVSVTQRSISELIEADKYLEAKKAARRKNRGLRYTKIVPPGAT
jgi:hypothetical protein